MIVIKILNKHLFQRWVVLCLALVLLWPTPLIDLAVFADSISSAGHVYYSFCSNSCFEISSCSFKFLFSFCKLFICSTTTCNRLAMESTSWVMHIKFCLYSSKVKIRSSKAIHTFTFVVNPYFYIMRGSLDYSYV